MDLLLIFLALFATFMFASLGALVSEKSGIVNISIEGGMILGGSSYLIFLQTFANMAIFSGNLLPIFIALIFTIFILMIWNMALGFATITMLGDHIIAGTALNLLAPVLAIAAGSILYGKTSAWPTLIDIINKTSGADAGWSTLNQWEYLGIILILLVISFAVISFLLYFSKWGLRLKATGENPYAVETAGVSVNKTRYGALLIVGVLTALSSMAVVLVFSSEHLIVTVRGLGYISFGILIFGSWRIKGITFGSFIIAIVMVFALQWTFIKFIKLPDNLQNIMYMIPFILPLIFLMIFKAKAGPSAAGKPFKKDLRE